MTDNVEPLNTEPPEQPSDEPARVTVNYPSPIFPDFDQAGMPCPTCHTKAPLPTVRCPLPNATPVNGQVPCAQVHKSCWDLVAVMQHHATVAAKKNGHKLALPPAKRLILPPGM
jgi:hypothetical protein